jgi:thiol:disulfide interchange protein
MNKEEFLRFLAENGRPGQRGGMFAGTALYLVILLTLLGGHGLNLTPCVLPMIPVNLAIIGAGEGRTTGFRRGALYGAGMAVAYGVLGAVVVYTGGSFGTLNSSSWFNFAVALLFAVLACSMFGLFNFDLSRFAHISPGKIRGGRSAAAFVMGGVAALLAGACVAPVVVGVMVFAAGLYAQGNQLAPFMGLFLGLGMGLPWPFAAAGMAVLPKPGKFMVTVKYVFAFLILAGACWYAYLGWSLRPGNFSAQAEMIKLAEAGARAEKQKKQVLVDFYASWCKNCMAMKKSVLKDPEVIEALKKYEFVEFQAEKPGDPLIAPLLKLWKVPGFPAFVVAEP